MDPRLRRAYSRCVVEVGRGLLPELVNGFYDYLMIDLASITYGVRDPRAFPVNVRLAIDYGYPAEHYLRYRLLEARAQGSGWGED